MEKLDKKKLFVYMISDSSGDTVSAVCDATLSQFENINIKKYIWPMVRSRAHIDNMLSDIKKKPGIVLYTIVQQDLRQYLKQQCEEIKVPYISAIGGIINKFSECIGAEPSLHIPGGRHSNMDASYIKRIDAINFALTHDDGQSVNEVYKADILLLGVSRTSKSPTSLYLSQKGYKVANIPLVQNFKLDINIKQLKEKTLVIGLVISPEKLVQVRNSRFANNRIDIFHPKDYTDILCIRDEMKEARKLFAMHKLPVIDITKKAVEEVAAEIINLYFDKKGKHTTPID